MKKIKIIGLFTAALFTAGFAFADDFDFGDDFGSDFGGDFRPLLLPAVPLK